MRSLRRWLSSGVAGLLCSGAAAGWAQTLPLVPVGSTPPSSASVPAESASSNAAASPANADFGLAPYQTALAEKRLDAQGPLATQQLAEIIETAEAQLSVGRRAEAIAVLAAVLESTRFAPFAQLEEGRAATFLLGDALGRAGAYALAQHYLSRLIQVPATDSWYRRSVGRLVDLGLESGDPSRFMTLLRGVPTGNGAPWSGDVAYLAGILHERDAQPERALAA